MPIVPMIVAFVHVESQKVRTRHRVHHLLILMLLSFSSKVRPPVPLTLEATRLNVAGERARLVLHAEMLVEATRLKRGTRGGLGKQV